MMPTNFALNIFSRSAAGTKGTGSNTNTNGGSSENADNTAGNSENGATQEGPASSNSENGAGNIVAPPNSEEIPVDDPLFG